MSPNSRRAPFWCNMTDIPWWHETNYEAHEVVGLSQIALLKNAPPYDALRSYSTHRRTHPTYGPMPAPVCKISNRRLWLLSDIASWMQDNTGGNGIKWYGGRIIDPNKPRPKKSYYKPKPRKPKKGFDEHGLPIEPYYEPSWYI